MKARYILFAGLTITVPTMIFLLISTDKKTFHNTTVNENIIQIRDFSVNSDNTDLNTSVNGKVFIRGEEGIPEHVQIVASVEIDPKDWGGVAFYIPDHWYISNVTSSYPENEMQSKAADFVSIWTSDDKKYEWNAMIEVGRDRRYIPTGGGTGTVIIDIVPDQDINLQSETFSIKAEVGSEDKDGIKIFGPDSIEVPIALINY
ncbi:MAG: hypothetical protein H0Z33_11325 [Bacillaceae bacterium]|nr:hypothetical protein [Bacillaceae bacterium]